MIFSILPQLCARRIVLASGSPRRKDLLEGIGLKLDIVPSTFPETLDKSSFSHPSEYVVETARCKAREVEERKGKELNADIIIGADTVVVRDKCILEKPADEQLAFEMLKSLSGRKHEVYTGVVILFRHTVKEEYQEYKFFERTEVCFDSLSDDVIRGYVATKEPMDKAGGYGIQGLGGTLVSGLNGCYYNVVGFPIHRFCSKLVSIVSERS
eukprot:Nk52_evm87s221 gene=Nk52_evmTU87s221